MSFVNGINTIRGGKHVEYLTNTITKKLVDMTLTKKKKTVKPQHIVSGMAQVVWLESKIKTWVNLSLGKHCIKPISIR